MKRLGLDTSAYIRLARGDSALRVLLEEAMEILVPVTVLGELHAGFQLGVKSRTGKRQLAEFLALPGVRILEVTEAAAERYGVLVRLLKEKGTPIPTNDLWIAAAVMENGARLVAYDAHFEHIPGLMIEAPQAPDQA